MMQRIIQSVCCILIYIGLNHVNAQTTPVAPEDREIFCQVLDQSDKLPIVFATVSIKNKNNGVIADEDGYFRLPYKYKIQDDVLIISSIGYESKTIDAKSLKDGIQNTIYLKPKIEALNAVTITTTKGTTKKEYENVREIVGKAISKMRVNFPTRPHSYIGYYRDYQLLQNKYFNLNEGIIEVFDEGFQTNKLLYKNNQAAFYQFKQNSKFPKDTLLTQEYDNQKYKYIKDATISSIGGNELSILNVHNAIRNYEYHSFSFVHTFKEDFLNNHEFRIAQKLYLDDTLIYEIKFFAIEEVTGVKNTADGTIYIAADNYAIHKLECFGYNVGDPEPFFSVKIEYKPKGDRMFLNYISFNNKFKVKSRDDFQIDDVSFDQGENAFYVRFNNTVDKRTIENSRNFRFIYKRKKLKINSVTLDDSKTVKISLINGAIPSSSPITEETMQDLTYKIKNVTDITGRDLNKKTFIRVNQFRELFVQEVFTDKTLPDDLYFVNKSERLSESLINTDKLKNISDYWINSPLKATKN
ncbi:carboxypeptidase-like regulatory domain-containing protein [Psychroserpens algicola]|uniref:carboxypeptidase-like regulatory domain-containing protein n=1 Tax=Psychroserpens algicola TaxID=1719034 RepID=UPI001952F505|nr:carboxypeptidase-like regulatory domain-containing protein [Psychroserpens algicola]